MRDTLRNQTLYAALAIPFGTFLLGLLFWGTGQQNPMWAITSFVLVYDPEIRTAVGSGLSRLGHGLIGALLAVTTMWLFHFHKWILPLTLALAVLYSGFVLQFKGSWRAMMVTITLILGSALVAPNAEFQIVLMRAVEVLVGSLFAIALSWPYTWLVRKGEPVDAAKPER